MEEEFKDFIRLASWERLEYYSLKEAAAKSHKKLTKLSKKYNKILCGPHLRRTCHYTSPP